MEQPVQGFRLSPQQRRLWNLMREGGLHSPFRTAGILDIEGVVDGASLAAMFQDVIDRHEILRTRFFEPTEFNEPVQIVGLGPQVTGESALDWRGLSGGDLNRAAEDLLHAHMRAPFDSLRSAITVKLAQAGAERWLAFVTLSPLCGDAFSIAHLAAALAGVFASDGAPDSIPQYADLAGWLLDAEERDEAPDDSYWREQWRVASSAPASGTSPQFVPRFARRALPESMRPDEPAWQDAIFATFVYLLWRRHQEREGPVPLAVHSDGRPPELRHAVGAFAKYLPVPVPLNPLARFADWSAECTRQRDRALQQAAGFRVLDPAASRLPWAFGVADRSAVAANRGVRVAVLLDAAVSGTFDLSLECVRRPSGWALELTYNSELVSDVQAGHLLDALPFFVGRFLSEPSLRLCNAPAMGERESHAVVSLSSGDTRTLRGPALLHDAIAEQILLTPADTAIEFGSRSLTYAELDAASQRIADSLVESGAGPDRIVAVWGERSLEFPVALLAVLRAGAAFLALDPDLPPERLAGMVNDARPVLLLAPVDRVDSLAPMACPVVSYGLDGVAGRVPAQPGISRTLQVSPDNLAYCIYTSGSTGKPKGALISHRAIVNQMEWIQREWPLKASDHMLLKTSCGFDPSVWEVFWPLLHGARVVVAAPTGHRDPSYLCKLMAERKVSSSYFVPSMITSLLADPGIRNVTSFGWILAGGEAVSMDVIRAFHQAVRGEFVHLYGPAEASIAVLGCVIPRGDRSSFADLGEPVSNSQVYLVDEFLQLVPDGSIGEICIGGLALGRGYLNLPALTAITWVPDPFAAESGARMYRTGDLARRHAGGQIEFVGRADRQVKIHGSRVELSDIEFHLNAIPAVRQGAIAAQQDGDRSKRLVAYVVVHDGCEDRAALRRELQARLPAYMVPYDIVFLDRMPLNMNGKLDRKRLPEMARRREAETTEAGTMSSAEHVLAKIWKEVLGVEEVARDSDFFMLGGHSLLAAQVAARIERELGISVPLRLMLDLTTVGSFAPAMEYLVAATLLDWPRESVVEALDGYAANPATAPLRWRDRVSETSLHEVEQRLKSALGGSSAKLITRLRKQEARLSFAQRRMWFLERLSERTSLFNVPIAIRFAGNLSIDRLESALTKLVERHETLRTAFLERAGEPLQRILPSCPVAVEMIDCEDDAALDHRLRVEAWRPLDLQSAPHLRAMILGCPAGARVLLLTLHHIVCDDWSMGVLTRDLLAFYDGQGASLPPLAIQYADFADWEHEQSSSSERHAGLAWWRDYLRDLPAELPLPVDGCAGVQPNAGALHAITLPPDLAPILERLGRSRRATLYMLLLASFDALLYCLSEATDIVVGSPFANRERPETASLIGLLLNPLAIRTRLHAESTFEELLESVRESVTAAYDRRDVPFEAVLSGLDNPRSRNPFRVWLSVQNAPMPQLELEGVDMELLLLEPEVAKFDLSLLISQQTLSGFFEYRKDMFAGKIESIVEFWVRLLRWVADSPQVRVSELRTAWLESAAERERNQAQAALADFQAAAGRRFEQVRGLARRAPGGAP